MNALQTATRSNRAAEVSRRPIEDTPRERFLRYTGLQRDVFAHPVAELEYSLSSRSKPSFSPLSFFVDPAHADQAQDSIFQDLRRQQHTFVFGRPGDGKTTTCLALEAHVRAQPEQTLIVTYAPGRTDNPPTLDGHLAKLVGQVAIALFVQIVEQFAFLTQDPGKRQRDGLLWLLPFGGQPLARVLGLLAHGDEPAATWGFAELWRYLNRPIVRPVIRSERLRQWLIDLEKQCSLAVATPAIPPPERWRKAIGVVKSWGYKQLYITVDGVDVWQRTADAMMVILDGLLGNAAQFESEDVFLKGFFPLELKQAVETAMATVVPAAHWYSLTLEWSTTQLTELLYARFRAGGSGRLGLDDLVEPELEQQIDDALIAEAYGSPRRLLTRIDQLINIHVSRDPLERLITTAEWEEAGRRTNMLLADK